MADSVQIAAWEGGALRVLDSGNDTHEAVLALPLGTLLVKMVRVPPESKDDPVAFIRPLLQEMSPYPDETLTIGYELIREDERGMVVMAAALPEGGTEALGEAIDAKKLSVTKVDLLAIGELRGLWPSLGVEDGARRVVLLNGPDCISAIVLDGDSPSSIRAIGHQSALGREIMLSLLEAEDFGGAKDVSEIVIVGRDGLPEVAEEPLAVFAPVRKLEIGEDAALVGVAERATDPSTLDALPESWREMLFETRFKSKIVRCLAVAGIFWALLLGVYFGVPFAYGFMIDHQKQLCKEHKRQYEMVMETKQKVELVRKYSDHSRGALEIMKAVSDRLPGSITLNKWDYRRDDGVKISGEAEVKDEVYTLKENLDAVTTGGEDEDGDRVFPLVKLNGPSDSKGRFKFDIECGYKTEGEED